MPTFTDYYRRRTGTVPDDSPRTSCVTIHNRGPSSMGRARRSPKTPFSFGLEPRNTGCRRTVIDLNSRETDRREESMATTATHQEPTPERFFNAINAYEQTEAMKAAVELEVFTAIAEGNTNAATIAKRCAAAERGVRTLCDFLTIHGFLTKEGAQYALAPDSALFLDRHSSAYLGAAIEFLLTSRLREGHARLTEAVRRGGSALGEGTLEPENPDWVKFAQVMMPLMHMPAEIMAAELRDRKSTRLNSSHSQISYAGFC